MTIDDLIKKLARVRDQVGGDTHVETRNSAGDFDHCSQLAVLYGYGDAKPRITLD